MIDMHVFFEKPLLFAGKMGPKGVHGYMYCCGGNGYGLTHCCHLGAFGIAFCCGAYPEP